jgi:hypothetical protein
LEMQTGRVLCSVVVVFECSLTPFYACVMTADLPNGPLALGKRTSASAVQPASSPVAKRKTAKRRETKRERMNHKARKAQKNEPKRPLLPSRIFGNERRFAIIEAIRAKGRKVSPGRIRKQIAALWDAATDKPTYFALAHKDKARYADEKAAFDWEESCTRSRPAASFEDAAPPPPAHYVVPPNWASASAAVASAYRHAVGHLQPFLVPVNGSWVDPKTARQQRTRWAALPPCAHMQPHVEGGEWWHSSWPGVAAPCAVASRPGGAAGVD